MLTILYEDEDLIFCIKPAGVVSEDPGMPALLRQQCGAAEIFCVHRLDREAAGLMVYAKSRRAAAGISAQIADGQMEKEYLALAEGKSKPQDTLRDLLFRDASRNKSYVVKRPRKGVREAELSYECLRQGEGLSLLRIKLKTGRSHQIRVQLASRKMPLVGDRKYGSSRRDCPLGLWSACLRLRHPRSGEAMCFRCPPPDTLPWTLLPEEKSE